MSSKDRNIIWIAILGMLVSLAGAGLMMPSIREERRLHDLVVNEKDLENLPPRIAVAHVMLGPFRGFLVSTLWMRAEELKENGKFYESLQLARWITTLQPRFAMVWSNRAWDMAYNISVGTHTEQERWMWVRKGIELIRDEGLRHNPQSVHLHKELAYMFQHKVGQFSDDMHWYYKQEWAWEWHRLLGPPIGTTQDVLDRFRPVAEAYDKWVNRDYLPIALRNELGELQKDAEVGESIRLISALTFAKFEIRMRRLYDRLRSKEARLGKKLDKAMQLIAAHKKASHIDSVERLIADVPGAREMLTALKEIDETYGADLSFVLAYGEARMKSDYIRLYGKELGVTLSDREAKIMDWVAKWGSEDREAFNQLIYFIQARVIHEHYKMDPIWMFELMLGDWCLRQKDRLAKKKNEHPAAMPIDWRHPMAHAMYWASQGVRRSRGLLRPQDEDVMNTERGTSIPLQELFKGGRIVFDPQLVPGRMGRAHTRRYDQLPELRMVAARHYMFLSSIERIENNPEVKDFEFYTTFRNAHEMFLKSAVSMLYVYGAEKEADRWYRELRTRHGDRDEERRKEYTQPLDLFAFRFYGDMVKRAGGRNEARSIVEGLILMGLREGLEGGRRQAYENYFAFARRTHEEYNKDKVRSFGKTGNERLALPPFNEVYLSALTRFLCAPARPGEDWRNRRLVWRRLPEGARKMMLMNERMRNQLSATAQRSFGLKLEEVFPLPEGLTLIPGGTGPLKLEKGNGKEK